MAVTTTFSVYLGQPNESGATTVNLTSRVTGASVRQSCEYNTFATSGATVTITNNDGAFTPGGGGTYGTRDFFRDGLFVYATVTNASGSTTTGVFFGVVTDVDVFDDGVTSTVTFEAVDAWQFVGTSPSFTASYSTGVVTPVQFAASSFLNYPRVALPGMGRLYTAAFAIERMADTLPLTAFGSSITYTNANIADVMINQIMPAASTICWPGRVYKDTTGGNIFYATQNMVTGSMTRANGTIAGDGSTNNRINYVFKQSALGLNDLPFNSITQEFNNGELVNRAEVTDTLGNSTTAVSATSVGNYGGKTERYTATLPVINETADVVGNIPASTVQVAARLANRRDTTQFIPSTLVVTAGTVEQFANDGAAARWTSLLSVDDGFYQQASITFQGKGSTSQTDQAVIWSRTLEITPDDCRVTFGLKSWVTWHSFILDIDKLDTDRLG